MTNNAVIELEGSKEKKKKNEQLALELAIIEYQDAVSKNNKFQIEETYNKICNLYPVMNFVYVWQKRYLYLYDTAEDFTHDYLRIFCTSLISWKPKHLRKINKYNGSGDFKNYFWSSLQNNYINMVKAENSGKRSLSSRCPLCEQWCASLSTHLIQYHEDYLWDLMIESGFNFDGLDACPFCQSWKIPHKSTDVCLRKRGRPSIYEKYAQEWLVLYNNNENYSSIANKYNTNSITVKRVIDNKINKTNNKQIDIGVSEETIKEWIKLSKENISCKKIAKRFNLKYSFVYYRLKNITKYKNEIDKKNVSKKLKKHILSMHSNYLFEYFKEKFPGAIPGQTAKPSSIYVSADDESDLNMYDTIGYSGKMDDLYNSGLSDIQQQIINKIFNDRTKNSLIIYDAKVYNCSDDDFQNELEDLKQKMYLCGID